MKFCIGDKVIIKSNAESVMRKIDNWNPNMKYNCGKTGTIIDISQWRIKSDYDVEVETIFNGVIRKQNFYYKEECLELDVAKKIEEFLEILE